MSKAEIKHSLHYSVLNKCVLSASCCQSDDYTNERSQRVTSCSLPAVPFIFLDMLDNQTELQLQTQCKKHCLVVNPYMAKQFKEISFIQAA